MTIAIVSALPKSSPPPVANIVEGSDGAGPAQDFAFLLFEQLSATPPGVGLIPGTASESAAGDSESWSTEDDAASDPLDLLVVLTQAPLERRSEAVWPEETPSAGLTGASQELLADETTDEPILTSWRMAQDRDISPAKPASANEPAAKFAVPLDAVSPDAVSLGAVSPGAVSPGAVSPDAVLPDVASGEWIAPVREPVAMAAVTPGMSARASDASPAVVSVSTPLHDRGWSDDFARKVSWIAGQRHQFAELTLNPPALGNIEISLQFDSDKSSAVATFVSGNAEVRETIETALPRLREMLAGVGIELGQAQVSAESFRQAPGNERNPGHTASRSGDDMAILASDPQAERTAAPAVDGGRGLVDMFV